MRRTIVIIIGLILVVLIGLIGLLPSYVLSSARKNEVLERTRILNSTAYEADESDLQAWLLRTNERLKAFSPTLDTDRPAVFIERILDQKIKGVRVTGFSWVKVKDVITLSVSGIAKDRQNLITFQNRINSSGYFSEVTLPISNLAKDKDIDFKIKFSPL